MRPFDTIIILLASFKSVGSIPHMILPPPELSPFPFDPLPLQQPPLPHQSTPPRQVGPFSNLLIPKCALTCYLDAIPSDGCALEIDLRCHCSNGNILMKAEACIEAGCSKTDQDDATQKVINACKVVSISPTIPKQSASSTPSLTTLTLSNAESSVVTATRPPPASSAMSTETVPTVTPQPPSNAQPSGPSSSSSATLSSETTSTSPTATDISPIPPTSNRSLSDGAKAGISISVLFVASVIFIALSLYIRRLKRQLALAKAAANVPDSVLRSPSRRHTLPDALFTSTRRQSWQSDTSYRGRRLSRRDIPYTSESPVSPLAPAFFRDNGNTRRSSVTGVPGNKRGHILSVVMEREDEDASSLLSRREFREPVPGQSEGLVDPLELDGGSARQIFEAPTSITPRERSVEEQGRWKEYDFGKF